MKPNRKHFCFITALILLTAAGWKAALLLWGKFPFNADEAVVALMARHILAGARPVFFYGQAYMGSLDAFLVAGGFALFGEQVWVIRLLQTALYLLCILVVLQITTHLTGKKEAAYIAGALMAVPTVNVMLYSTVSLGGYNEALLIGLLLTRMALCLEQRLIPMEKTWKTALTGFVFGVLAGLGVWANGLTLVYILPAGAYLQYVLFRSVRHTRRWSSAMAMLLAGLCGALVGALPYWLYGFRWGWGALFGELFGSAVSVETGSYFAVVLDHLRNLVLLGLPALLGIRPPWEVRWLLVPLMPFVLLFWGWVALQSIRLFRARPADQPKFLLLVGAGVMVMLGFLLTSFGVDPSGRYFLPLAPLLAIAAGMTLVRVPPKPRYAVLGLILVFHAGSTVQCALKDPPALTTQFYAPSIIDHDFDQALMDFLRANGETRGYTNYWTAYPLAFLSGEELIFVPRLPYHPDLRYTERDDRYPPYTEAVKNASRVAYITTNLPVLDAYLRTAFQSRGVSWSEARIGDYQVYYALSRPVHPGDIGLGSSRVGGSD